MAHKKDSSQAKPNAISGQKVFENFLGGLYNKPDFIRFQWVDFTATVRTRVTTLRQARRLAKEGLSIPVASPQTDGFLVDGSFHNHTPGQKDSLVPDWSSLTYCHYKPHHAAVMCSLDEAGKDFDCCTRSVLKKLEHEIETKHDLTFKVGVEIEFYLTAADDWSLPVKDVRSYCSTASLRTPCLAVLEDAVAAIEDADIHVWTFHSELVSGLYEISTEPMTPLQAADALVYIHEAIKTAAVQHGMHATMHPKPFDKTHGVGQHLHVSLSSETKEDSFLAGVLASVPAISAISMPNYDSWLRRDFAGGDWVGWDVENRRSCVRKIRKAYWEFRFVDGTANAYLALAAILGVGMAAWEKGQELKVKPMSQWSSTLDEDGRKESGVAKRTPRDLKEAIESLKVDDAVKAVLGKELTERFIKYKEHEEKVLEELTLPERRKVIMELF